MNKLRWFAILPVAIAAWWLAIVITIAGGSLIKNLWSFAESGLTTFGASLGAVLVVTACTLVAPSNRPRVAWYSLVFGACIPVAIAFVSVVPELPGAILAGGVVAALLSVKFRHDGLTTRWSGP